MLLTRAWLMWQARRLHHETLAMRGSINGFCKFKRRRLDRVAEQPQWVFKKVAVVLRLSAIRDDHGHAFSPPGPASALSIIRRLRWDVTHPDLFAPACRQEGDWNSGTNYLVDRWVETCHYDSHSSLSFMRVMLVRFSPRLRKNKQVFYGGIKN